MTELVQFEMFLIIFTLGTLPTVSENLTSLPLEKFAQHSIIIY